MNLQDKAEAVIVEFDHRVAGMKRKVTEAGFTDKPVSRVEISAENLEVLNESYALVVYADDDDFRAASRSPSRLSGTIRSGRR